MNNTRSTITKLIITIAGIAILIFITSRILPYLQGPYISEINLEEEQLQEEYWFVIEGIAKNTETISINTIKAPLAEDGSFTHPFALNQGRNEIIIIVSDGFEDTKQYSYNIVTPTLEEFYAKLYNEAVEADTEEETEPEELSTDQQEPVVDNE